MLKKDKRSDGPSESTGSLDGGGQAGSSSENTSMTSGEKSGRDGWNSTPMGAFTERMGGARRSAMKAMPATSGYAGASRSAASPSQGPQTLSLIHIDAADESSDSSKTMFYEDPNEQVKKRGGYAAKVNDQSYVRVGASDDSMSQETETAKPNKGAVTLTIE